MSHCHVTEIYIIRHRSGDQISQGETKQYHKSICIGTLKLTFITSSSKDKFM